jgi:hypothetical protein
MMTPTQPAITGEAQSGWWPSKYGAEDQAGALNEITPGKVLQAAVAAVAVLAPLAVAGQTSERPAR